MSAATGLPLNFPSNFPTMTVPASRLLVTIQKTESVATYEQCVEKVIWKKNTQMSLKKRHNRDSFKVSPGFVSPCESPKVCMAFLSRSTDPYFTVPFYFLLFSTPPSHRILFSDRLFAIYAALCKSRLLFLVFHITTDQK